jgi:hypothetical protein
MVSDGKSRDQLSTREKKGNLRKVVFWQIKTFLVSKEDFFFLLNIIYCNYFTFSLKSFKFSRTRHISF